MRSWTNWTILEGVAVLFAADASKESPMRLSVRALVPMFILIFCLLPALCHPQPPPASPPKPHPEVQALLDKGLQFKKEYRWNEALRLYEEALTKARALQDRAGEATLLSEIGI